MSEEVAVERTRELIQRQNLGVLATSERGHPYTSLVYYAELPSLSKIVFFTRRDRTKYHNLKADGRISMYIDSRKDYPGKPSKIEGVTLVGVAWEIKTGKELMELRELYLNKNPHMAELADDPESSLFRINVESYKYVVNFDDALILTV